MKIIFTILFVFLFFTGKIFSQNNCEVIPEPLKGVYTGECHKGKAYGEGKALGKDTYEGTFKNGYPEGIGKYVWKTQDYFTGRWKKGERDGNGEMHYKTPSGEDSVITGFWKKDKYIGLYEKDYIVQAMTPRINRIDCNISDVNGNDIKITMNQVSGSTSSLRGNIPEIVNVSVMSGTFIRRYKQNTFNRSITQFQTVDFPFRVILFISNGESAEIIFNRKADYDVEINMQL